MLLMMLVQNLGVHLIQSVDGGQHVMRTQNITFGLYLD
jgi:hypothetical protein